MVSTRVLLLSLLYGSAVFAAPAQFRRSKEVVHMNKNGTDSNNHDNNKNGTSSNNNNNNNNNNVAGAAYCTFYLLFLII